MLATEAAAPISGAGVFLLAIAFLIILLAGVYFVQQRRNSRSKQTVQVGSEVQGANHTVVRRGRRSGRRPAKTRTREDVPASSGPAWPSRSGLVRQVQRLKLRGRGTAPQEPWLDAEVVVYGPWFSTLCHGYCGPEDGPRLVVRAATLRGLRHRYDGTPGQDALGVVWNERRNALFAVVADGLGSMTASGEAAQRAVRAALRCSRQLGDAEDLAMVLASASESVEDFNDRSPAKGTTTLVVSEIRRTRAGVLVTTLGVGDSEAWVLRGGGWKALHHERRKNAESVTRHLPSDSPRRTREPVAGGSVVLLASDGFASALGPGSPLGQELAGRWQRPPVPLDFLAQVDFENDRFTDDRAAVAVWIQ